MEATLIFKFVVTDNTPHPQISRAYFKEAKIFYYISNRYRQV